jgi:transcriptional regulator with XRE-family HTH domain
MTFIAQTTWFGLINAKQCRLIRLRARQQQQRCKWPAQVTVASIRPVFMGSPHAPRTEFQRLSQCNGQVSAQAQTRSVAYDCGINRTYLSAVERAERNVSIDNIARIAKALQVEPWKLLKDD